jgi:hypothetical protein
MKTSRPTQLSALAALLLAAACAAEKPPDFPSWDLDVYPILRGSCSHCHGVTAKPPPASPFTRYDVCNAAAFNMQGFTIMGGASPVIAGFVRPTAGPARMPPPPAAPLSDYEATVLERWARNPSCLKQVPNRKPTVVIVQPLARSGNKATVTLEVIDPDGDQVLGKAKLGDGADSANNTFLIPGAGRWTIEFTGGGASDRLTVQLFDGYDKGP